MQSLTLTAILESIAATLKFKAYVNEKFMFHTQTQNTNIICLKPQSLIDKPRYHYATNTHNLQSSYCTKRLPDIPQLEEDLP